MVLILILSFFLIATAIFIFRYYRLKSRVIRKLSQLPREASGQWTTEFLEEKRSHTDPVADQLVEKIMAKNEMTEVNHLFQIFVRDSDHLPASAPKEIKEYFKETAQLPDWADEDLLALGQQIYIRHGVWISLLLNYKSLPECYACAKGAEVLFHTARLNEKHGSFKTYSRRIAETAQFVLFTMSPGGLELNGNGMVAAQKVRLIHAIIRYYLRKQDWDVSKYDEPINQEDMAGTLMAFSALVLEGLEKLGIQLEGFEKEAYIHCWRVIGHIMGLDENMIPANSADALQLGHAILDHQMAESDRSKTLTKALMDFQDQQSKPFMSPEANRSMMHLLMDKQMCDLLGVPEVPEKKVKKLSRRIRRITWISEFLDHSLIFAMFIQFLSKIGLQLVINKMTQSKVINFYLPKSLKKDWGFSQGTPK